tara:strand:- start:638 stop:1684 length:1047 start_codon:yes stop_codon:yes gene_type:complete
MKSYKLYIYILIVFLKTGNVLSNPNIFHVNNITVEEKSNVSNDVLANQAIQKGFKELINKILLKEDLIRLGELQYSAIKELVSYYQVSNKISDVSELKQTNFNITFDKDKMHHLFHKKGISYSKISDNELFILPILKKNDKIFIYNQNFFYDNWNENSDIKLIEHILLLENIEIVQNINLNKNNLLNLNLANLFAEYPEKNIALIIIEENNTNIEKVYFKTRILGTNFIKNINIKRLNLNEKEFYKKIIVKTKQEISNLIKSQNLIDIRTPSFLKVKLKIDEKNNLVELNKRFKKVDSVENVYIQKFNNDIVILKIKYLGKLDKIIRQMDSQKITLKLFGDQWNIKVN